jgi:hypothetical protein
VTYAAGGAGNQDAPSHMSGRSGNFANRQWRVGGRVKNWPMEFPQKAFESETRQPPLAAQERVTRSGRHFAGT